MTSPTLNAVPDPAGAPAAPVRAGTRAARMRQPIAADALRTLAESHGVCVRPLAIRRTDTATGQTNVIEVPCGARLASKCKPCAERNRRLRIQQIREGWHLAEEPTIEPERPGQDILALVRLRAHFEFERAEAERASQWDQLRELDAAIADVDEALAKDGLRGHLTPHDRQAKPRKQRSTKRRQDAPELPRLPVDARTVGRVYAGRQGKTYRPSMLLTLTLGSYGSVHSAIRRGAYLVPCECGHRHGERDDLLGTPIDPGSYDYRRAALDAIHFARVLDRWWQNLRRAAGWNIQYAGAVELQRRLAPHAHFAIRGTTPRRLLKQVAAATYHHVWWPRFDTPVYTVDRPPTWDPQTKAYLDPKTRQPLNTWDQALTELDDEDATPAYIARLGTIDARGVENGTKDSERAVRYVTKYLTKDIVEHANPRSDAQRAHFDRLHAELSVLPCSPTCANWLLYGVQPDGTKPGLVPGRCTGKVHQRRTLGFTGRRVLISRQWSNKTLADHRGDNRAWVQAVLAGAVDGHEHDQADTQPDPADQSSRYRFELARPGDPDLPPVEHRILRTISTRIRWRQALAAARQGPPGTVSATQDQPNPKAA